MIELLGTIVVLGILSAIAITGVTSMIDKSKKESDISLKQTLEEAAKSYYEANSSIKPNDIGESKIVSASELKKKNYLKENIVNSKKESCMEKSYVKITKKSLREYNYEAYLYCGDDEVASLEEQEKPYIEVKFINSQGVEVLNTSKIKDINLNIKIKGTITDETVGITSYNYVIYLKTNKYNTREVYNSGNINAYNKPEIEVTKKLDEYIDVTAENTIYVYVKAINTLGESYIYNNGSIFEDKELPQCEIINLSIGENDWLNKKDIDMEKTREISVTCIDKYGSGCIRPSFTRIWPNSQQQSAEFGYVQVSNNKGNKSVPDNYLTDDICTISNKENSCLVRVNVDGELPQAKINSKVLSSGSFTTNNQSEVYKINEKSYSNSVNNWLNKTNYPNGLELEIEISDNLYLESYKWETNEANKKSLDNDYTKISYVQNDEAKQKVYDNDSSTYPNCDAIRKEKIKVGFKEEGKRQGKLTITDKAGNSIVIYIRAFIDKTAPTISFTTEKDGYKINATTTDKLSGVKSYYWSTQNQYKNYSSAKSKTTESIEIGSRDGSNITFWAKDAAGNENNSAHKKYVLCTKTKLNGNIPTWEEVHATRSQGIWTGTSTYRFTYDYKDCSGSEPKRVYKYEEYGCQCNLDKYTGVYCSLQAIGDFTTATHYYANAIIYYKNSEDGKKACNAIHNVNSYVLRVCKSPNVGSDPLFYHGYYFYSGAVGAYNNFNPSAYWHHWTPSDPNSRITSDHTPAEACAQACYVRYK